MNSGFNIVAPAIALALSLLGSAAAESPRANNSAQHQAQPAGNSSTAAVPVSNVTAANAEPALEVSCRKGLLSITARNATLSEVLDQIHSCTGAIITAPLEINERVAVRLGPGPAAQIIAALLEGSRFNYIILGGEADGAAVGMVTLTLKPSGTAPYVPPPALAEEPLVPSRAMIKADLTGGDEGAWDNVELPSMAAAPSPTESASSAAPK